MLLEIKNLSFNFGGLEVSNNVNLSVEKNRVTALIGPNGSGKTTLFNIISGIYHPNEGEIIFKGENINKLKPYQVCEKGITRTYQTTNLFRNMTVLENVMVGLHTTINNNMFDTLFHSSKMKKIERNKQEEAINLLKLVDLENEKDLKAGILSYGKQRLLEIVRAISSNPKLLMLDEPAAGMNENEKKELSELIKKIIDMNITVLIVEHDMDLIMNLADKIYVINAGTNLAEGTPNEISNNKDVISAYLGDE